MRTFSELTGKERALELVRWVCVPAAAVLVVFALQMIARLVMPPVFAQLPGTPVVLPADFDRFVLPRIIGAVMIASSILAGAMVAPRYRLAAALVLAGLWTVYSFLSHVLVHLGRGTPHYLDFALAALAAFGMAAYIFYSERSKSRRPEQPGAEMASAP
jgi:hypothetical protein